jgi:hypothetical protein
MAARLLCLLLLGAALLPFQAAMATADDGPPRMLLSAAGRLRPAETVERAAAWAPVHVLVAVSGYGSDPTDRSYWLPIYRDTPDMGHVEFGGVTGTYDTRGPIATSGDALRRSIQRLVREEDVDEVAIVSISQGGNVTDAAFRSGLSSRDNVTTWTSIAAPLNGSTTARAILQADQVATLAGAHRELRDLIAPLGGGLEDPALVDLARPGSFTPPRDVRFTQFWSTGDEVVLHADADVPGATRLTLTPPPFIGPGHGGQVRDPRTRAMIVDAIRGNDPAVPAAESWIAERIAPLTDAVRLIALAILGVAFVTAAIVLAKAKLVAAYALAWRR